jgi:hypothetical protein
MLMSELGKGARKALISAVVAFGGGVLSSSTHAGYVATFQAYGAGQYASCGYRAVEAWDSTSTLNYYSIRAFQHEFSSGSGDIRRTWCAEIYQSVTVGATYDFTEVALEAVPTAPPGAMGFERATLVRDLMARWIDPQTHLVVGDAANRAAISAAFQLTIWEITHENFAATDASGMVSQMSLMTGAFRSNPSDAVHGWYAAMRDSLGVGGFQFAASAGLAEPDSQDQIYMIPGPGALAMTILLGGAFAWRRR